MARSGNASNFIKKLFELFPRNVSNFVKELLCMGRDGRRQGHLPFLVLCPEAARDYSLFSFSVNTCGSGGIGGGGKGRERAQRGHAAVLACAVSFQSTSLPSSVVPLIGRLHPPGHPPPCQSQGIQKQYPCPVHRQ